MSMRVSYFVIPLLVILVSVMGSIFTSADMAWYRSIRKPSWTPPGWFIGFMWTVIFILAAWSAVVFWNLPYWETLRGSQDVTRWIIAWLFVVNGILNVTWSYLFFSEHLISSAVYEAGILAFTVYLLIALLWPLSQTASFLLFLYAAWATFATYLTSVVWALNRRVRKGL
jgi:translocator protein